MLTAQIALTLSSLVVNFLLLSESNISKSSFMCISFSSVRSIFFLFLPRIVSTSASRSFFLDVDDCATVTVSVGGYHRIIVRFHANNPGYWLFHCHIEFHTEIGMALIFKVGEHEEMPPVPHNFSKCNNWKSIDDQAEGSRTSTSTPISGN